ncbi:MAG: MarR family transcriptional regulator [Acidobacteria bacterium]|nr:MarR family transcriptional regulator [Acidobacteriota bacterium]
MPITAAENLVWEVRRAFRDLAAASGRELEPLGILPKERAFLEFLARETQPLSLSAIAQKYSVSRQHIQQTYRAIAAREWIEEVPDTEDRRTVCLKLSRKGHRIWLKIRAIDEAFFERLAASLPPAKVEAATLLLQQLRRHIQEEGRQ